MEDRDDIPAGDEQALSDRIDDEIVNRELMERLDLAASPVSRETATVLVNINAKPFGRLWRH